MTNLGFLGYEPSDMEHVRLILAAAVDRGLTLADLAKSAEIADSLDAWDDTVSGWQNDLDGLCQNRAGIRGSGRD